MGLDLQLTALPPVRVPRYLQVSALKPEDPLPEDLMRRFYFTPYALLRCGRYAERIQPFLKHFKPEK